MKNNERRVLQEVEADPQCIDRSVGISSKRVPLQIALEKGHANLVRLLLEKKASHVLVESSVCIAAEKGSMEVSLQATKLLVENGASVNAIDSLHRSPLHIAADRSDVETMRFLLDSGALADKQSGTDQRTPLISLCANYQAKSRPALDLLIACDANVNAFTVNKFTPLHFLANVRFDGGYKRPSARREAAIASAVRVLVTRGANVNAVEASSSKTPLDLATGPAVIKALLEGGAHTADYMLCESRLSFCTGDLESVRLLLIAGVDPNKRCRKSGCGSPLLCSVMCKSGCPSDSDVVKLLIEHGANVRCWGDFDAATRTFRSAVSAAVEWFGEEDDVIPLLRLLRARGCYFNATRAHRAGVEYCCDPLAVAVQRGNGPAVSFLLAYGAKEDRERNNLLKSAYDARRWSFYRAIPAAPWLTVVDMLVAAGKNTGSDYLALNCYIRKFDEHLQGDEYQFATTLVADSLPIDSLVDTVHSASVEHARTSIQLQRNRLAQRFWVAVYRKYAFFWAKVLQPLEWPALVLIEVIDACFPAQQQIFVDAVPYHKKWAVVCTVKHLLSAKATSLRLSTGGGAGAAATASTNNTIFVADSNSSSTNKRVKM